MEDDKKSVEIWPARFGKTARILEAAGFDAPAEKPRLDALTQFVAVSSVAARAVTRLVRAMEETSATTAAQVSSQWEDGPPITIEELSDLMRKAMEEHPLPEPLFPPVYQPFMTVDFPKEPGGYARAMLYSYPLFAPSSPSYLLNCVDVGGPPASPITARESRALALWMKKPNDRRRLKRAWRIIQQEKRLGRSA